MKRMMLIGWLLVCAVPFAARADHEIDWNDWYEGDVQVRLRVDQGEGGLYAFGRPVRLKLEANEDAYHLVYAIDTDGYVRLLFPRPWEDDGWLFAHEELRLEAHDLAWPADRWGSGGIVYVEAVASPVPFDYNALGIVFRSGQARWVRQGRSFRVHGDPFLAFNDVHRILFPDWDQAVFAVDYTYFYVDHVREAPRYLGYRYQRVYLPPPAPVFSVGLRFVWHWEFGRRYCRPLYGRYYVPGRHVVHHRVHHHHHVVYRTPAAPPVHRRPASIPWVAPGHERRLQDPPVVRQRQRPSVDPVRQRERASLLRIETNRAARSVANVSGRSLEKRREAEAPPAQKRATVQRAVPLRRAAATAAKRAESVRRETVKEASPRQTRPRPVAQGSERGGKERRTPQSKPKQERREAKEKSRQRR